MALVGCDREIIRRAFAGVVVGVVMIAGIRGPAVCFFYAGTSDGLRGGGGGGGMRQSKGLADLGYEVQRYTGIPYPSGGFKGAAADG